MKKLVMFYSLDGNCKLIGESIAKDIDADIFQVRTVKDLSKKGKAGKLFWGGRQVMMNKKPEIEKVDLALDQYDLIFLGTPVWVGTYAPPLDTLFEQVKIKGKKIAVFYCHGGGPGKIKEKLTDTLAGNEIVDWIDFKDPLKHSPEESTNRAINWAHSIIE